MKWIWISWLSQYRISSKKYKTQNSFANKNRFLNEDAFAYDLSISKMKLIWCISKNYLDNMNFITVSIPLAFKKSKIRVKFQHRKYHWNDAKQRHKLIFVGINRLKFILLEVVFVFSKELNCTSNCTYDYFICCIKLRK